jgi:exopolyphosphatase / guanosine-5'-triphosphate,3'-diphosphate pyrophosphatase
MTSRPCPRLAAIDIGTNSVLLTIAEPEEDGSFSLLTQRATITRLGQGVDQTGTLDESAAERTLGCLADYKMDLSRFGVIRCKAVGTSALRDAQGGSDFVERAAQILGSPPEIISGRREAELTFAGALSGLPLMGPTFVFDIGGGSTELIVGHSTNGTRTIENALSLNIGSVRLTERFQVKDPPTAENADSLRQEVMQALRLSPLTVAPGTLVVGVAGTVTTLAAIAENMATYDAAVVHGYALNLSTVSELARKLGRMTVAERLRLPGLSEGRADVIFAGAILCEEIMKHVKADELIVSDRGVRFGLLEELREECR